MFHYTNEKDMKNFLDKNVVCKTKEDKRQLLFCGNYRLKKKRRNIL